MGKEGILEGGEVEIEAAPSKSHVAPVEAFFR